MTTTAIRLENISKTFGLFKKVQAVKNASFEVETGQVYGFLGPNGAGKTTAIRLMLDMMRPSNGTAYIYGKPVRRHHDILRRVGALVEGATYYPYLSAQKNLTVLARTHGLQDLSRIDSLLKQVGLNARAKQRVKQYSMGMKQRYGLAAALLHDPDLLILDEPTNGLDPAGIQEMRVFIRDLVDKQGKTVFLSSHMLNEVEQICDRVAIISQGEIVREGSVQSMIQAASSVGGVTLRVSPLEQAEAVLQPRYTVQNGRKDGLLDVQTDNDDDVPQLVRMLVEQGIDVYEVVPQKHTLEDFFLSVTQQLDETEKPNEQPEEAAHVR